MNKKWKKLLSPKNMFILLIILVSIYIVTSFFNLFKNNKPTVIEANNKQFSKYESLDDNMLYLYKSEDSFIINDDKGNIIYETEEHITDFIFLDKENILISILSDDTINSDNIYSVKKLNLKSLKTEEIYNLNGEISMFSKNSNIVIVNNTVQKVFEFGSKTLSTNLPKKFDKVFSCNNDLFAVYYYIENNTVKSLVYKYTDTGFKDSFTFPGKISFISSDFNNSNKIYITYTSDMNNNPSLPVVCEKYLVNLSANDSGEKIYTHLNGRVISGSNGTYLLNTQNKELYILNQDLSIKSTAASLHNELPLSLVKIDKESGTLYCIDNKYVVRKDID